MRPRSVDEPPNHCSPLECGGPSTDGTCWCDPLCFVGGDCCANVASMCLGTQCRSNDECDELSYCARLSGCSAAGMCLPRPLNTTCDTFFGERVCGCDGETYGDFCQALQAGTSVASFDPCVGTQACTADDECVANHYCQRPHLGCAIPGVCVERPRSCDDVDNQRVCGCDGKTYDNTCQAHLAGVSLARDEPCEGLTGTCAGPARLPCADHTLCLDKNDGCDPQQRQDCWGYCATYCAGRAKLACGDPQTQCFDRIDGCDPTKGDRECRGFCAAPGPSCQGRCGEHGLDASCWCDEYCQHYGDCCSDREVWCE